VTLKPTGSHSGNDYLIIESTYGDRIHPKFHPAEEMEKNYQQGRGKKGVLVIPAFSVGRTQRRAYLIRKLEDENRIPQNFPVYLDSPMATEATRVYINFIPKMHCLIFSR